MSGHRHRAQRFLVLEILDAEIVLFLSTLRREFGSNVRPEVHITVRGPYMEPIKGDDIDRFQDMVQGSTILLRGFDIFDNPSQSVVYLRAHNSQLRKIWWKPDYPSAQFGFNPHISILKTKDRKRANEVFRFLNRQGLEFECKEFRLVPLTRKQGELFPFPPSSDKELYQWSGYAPTAVGVEVVEEAANLVANYRAQQHLFG